jgi:hypothetical protein
MWRNPVREAFPFPVGNYCKVGGITRPDEKSTHWPVSSNIFGGNLAAIGLISSKS